MIVASMQVKFFAVILSCHLKLYLDNKSARQRTISACKVNHLITVLFAVAYIPVHNELDECNRQTLQRDLSAGNQSRMAVERCVRARIKLMIYHVCFSGELRCFRERGNGSLLRLLRGNESPERLTGLIKWVKREFERFLSGISGANIGLDNLNVRIQTLMNHMSPSLDYKLETAQES